MVNDGRDGASVIPEELRYLVTSNVPAHLSITKGDGSLVTSVVWVGFDGEHLLVNSPVGSYKGRALRTRPQVALSVVDPGDPWRRLSISGHVVDFRPDENLAFIDTLSERYLGTAYRQRDRDREIIVIQPDRVRAMLGRGAAVPASR
jgi:PPOX class probable F420-dependent enzyme